MPAWAVAPAPEVLAWLLETEEPSPRYLALTQLQANADDEPPPLTARRRIHEIPPARDILDAQYPSGYWVKPDVGYSPRYRATTWQVLFLAQLGVLPVARVRQACDYVLDHSRRPFDPLTGKGGDFLAGDGSGTALLCLNGNMLWALSVLGYGGDPRFLEVFRSLIGRLSRTGFTCRHDENLPCSWAVIKVLLAFSQVAPVETAEKDIRQIVDNGLALLLDRQPFSAPRSPACAGGEDHWLSLGFPRALEPDILEGLEAVLAHGAGGHPQVGPAIDWLVGRQDPSGRWGLDRVPGRMWADFGRVGAANKWVTIRAWQVLLRYRNAHGACGRN